MKKIILFLLISVACFSQAPTKNANGFATISGADTMNSSAIFEARSTSKGFLAPRMSTTQKNAISSPATGLIVFDTTLGVLSFYNGTVWMDVNTNPVWDLDDVLNQGNTSDQSLELNNTYNQTIIEPAAFSTQNISTTAGVSLGETGVGIFTQNESLAVEIHTDSISESYIAQFPDKVIVDDEPEIFVFQSDLTAFSATIGLPTILANNNETGNIVIKSDNGDSSLMLDDTEAIFDYEGSSIKLKSDAINITSAEVLNLTTTDVININGNDTVNVITSGNFYYNGNEVLTTASSVGTVTSVTGVSGETTVASGTTTPVIGISSTYTTARDAYADAKVENNTTASTTVAPSKTAVNIALDLKVNKTTWVDYSATSTVVGWSSFTTKKISYKIIDDAMVVDFNIEGTSNATTISFTIPSNAGSATFVLSAYIINNGSASSNPGRISTVSGSNVVTVQRDGQNTAFTGSGTKRCSGQIFIQL